VPPETLASLTEPVVRGHPTSSRRHAGLGLAIAAALVETHGGELRLTLPQRDTFSAEVALLISAR
jgi:signal transduction histidine kinase